MSTPRNTPRTHPLEVSYLVVGLVFIGLAGSWALKEMGVIDLGEVRWLFPLTLVIAGLIGLFALTARGLSRRGSPPARDSRADEQVQTWNTSHPTEHHGVDEGGPR